MKLKITVHGVAYEVDVEVLDAGEGFPQAPQPRRNRSQREGDGAAPLPRPSSGPSIPSGNGGSVTSPIAGTIVEIKCKSGDGVKKDQVLLVIEAMKMKTSIAAPTDGTVKNVPIAVGDSVREGQVLVELA
ncbi:MAG: biotin/lipoyl-containing protein [Candidatus Zixiibacteriota bacterium]